MRAWSSLSGLVLDESASLDFSFMKYLMRSVFAPGVAILTELVFFKNPFSTSFNNTEVTDSPKSSMVRSTDKDKYSLEPNGTT